MKSGSGSQHLVGVVCRPEGGVCCWSQLSHSDCDCAAGEGPGPEGGSCSCGGAAFLGGAIGRAAGSPWLAMSVGRMGRRWGLRRPDGQRGAGSK